MNWKGLYVIFHTWLYCFVVCLQQKISVCALKTNRIISCGMRRYLDYFQVGAGSVCRWCTLNSLNLKKCKVRHHSEGTTALCLHCRQFGTFLRQQCIVWHYCRPSADPIERASHCGRHSARLGADSTNMADTAWASCWTSPTIHYIRSEGAAGTSHQIKPAANTR